MTLDRWPLTLALLSFAWVLTLVAVACVDDEGQADRRGPEVKLLHSVTADVLDSLEDAGFTPVVEQEVLTCSEEGEREAEFVRPERPFVRVSVPSVPSAVVEALLAAGWEVLADERAGSSESSGLVRDYGLHEPGSESPFASEGRTEGLVAVVRSPGTTQASREHVGVWVQVLNPTPCVELGDG